jgi:hypothetical protein
LKKTTPKNEKKRKTNLEKKKESKRKIIIKKHVGKVKTKFSISSILKSFRKIL